MSAYYNEFDPFAAQWLQNLIAAGHIAAGDVDERSIVDVRPDDLRGYTQCHFFAGIGGWSYALRLAGWGDERPVWTGSCPCQPFSAAGKQKAEADERHLWPEFRRLIAECRPPIIFGEQVASALGREWLGGKSGLQRLQDREAVIGVLSERDLFGRLPDALQRLLSSGRNEAQGAHAEGEAERRSQEMATTESRRSPSSVGDASGATEGAGLHVGPGFDPSGDRRRRVPDDRHPVQSGRRPDVGQSVNRSLGHQQGLHAREHEGGAVLHQRDGEHLGREQDRRDRGSDHGEAAKSLSGVSAASRIRIEAAAEFEQLSGVRADLEALAYAVGAADLCAAGCGAPHIRQRLWWVALADAGGTRSLPGTHAGIHRGEEDAGPRHVELERHGDALGLALAGGEGLEGRPGVDGELRAERQRAAVERGGEAGGVADANGGIAGHGDIQPGGQHGQQPQDGGAGRMADADGARPLPRAHAGIHRGEEGARPRHIEPERPGQWSGGARIPCADGKARRVGPGVFPLAHGVSARVGRLRGYGNAIVPQVAAEFIKAYRG